MGRTPETESEDSPPPRKHGKFDFVVSDRPKYIPNSGPPIAKAVPMPAHDRDGYIIDQVVIFAEPHYLVGYEKLPHLFVRVKLNKIQDWVSARAIEDFNNRSYDEQEREMEALELPLIEEKEERKRKRLEKISRGVAVPVTDSRKRKWTPTLADNSKEKNIAAPGSKKNSGRPVGPGTRHQPAQQGISFTSPKQSQHSLQQASLAAPGGMLANRTILDDDSDDEETEMALEYQLNGGRVQAELLSSRSASESRSISKPVNMSREGSPSDTSSSKRIRPHPPSMLSGKNAVAATSSREALKVYEILEKNAKRPATLAEKYSYTKRVLPARTFEGAHAGLAGPSRDSGSSSRGLAQAVRSNEPETPEEEDEEDEEAEDDDVEYEVRYILDDEVRIDKKGKDEIWYKIKWVGEWDDTWEPAENVGIGAINEYWEAKSEKSNENGNESDSDTLFVTDRKGKGKEVIRGQVVDDDDGEDEKLQWDG